MGTFTVKCPVCANEHVWFSGSMDQRCQNCKNQDKVKEKTMDYEQAHLDALNKVITVQNELINYLKAEIERLKLTQLYIGPGSSPQPTAPASPWYQPYPNPQPFIPTSPGSPYSPPFGPPYIITSGDTTVTADTKPIIGGSLPPGSQQSTVVTTLVGDITKSFTSGDVQPIGSGSITCGGDLKGAYLTNVDNSKSSRPKPLKTSGPITHGS